MANSNCTLQSVIDDANSLGDVAPALATGGFSDAPALSIANDVMQAMINGGPDSQPYPWKWNRINVAPFSTISYQSDYFVPGLINFGWIENAWAVNINQTSVPKQKLYLDARKDIQVTYDQTGYPGKIAWMQNSNILTGVWGQTPLGPTASSPLGNVGGLGPGITGNQNPGPNVIYTNPVGVLNQPANATTCITDPNGNLWALTTFGTCGATQPTWPTTPVFPTVVDPTVVATTVTDGSVVWTAINPAGQGFRLNPIPAQTGTVWVVNVVGPIASRTLHRHLSRFLTITSGLSSRGSLRNATGATLTRRFAQSSQWRISFGCKPWTKPFGKVTGRKTTSASIPARQVSWTLIGAVIQ